MARRRDTFASALASLRLRAYRGEFSPGQSVVVVEEARRLRMSHTPVREALACLCGEGLIERSPNEGFLFPRLDVAVIRDRLRFRLMLLQIGIGAMSAAQYEPRPVSPSILTALQQHLARLVRAQGNVALYEAYRRVSSQLAPLRGAEKRVLDDVEDEATDLVAVLATRDRVQGEAALVAYHRRRIDAAPHLLLDIEGDQPFLQGKG